MRVILVATITALIGACSQPPVSEAAAEATPEAAKSNAAESKTKPPPLSEEDKRLIAMDPAELTP